jgi:hypothetical protein
MRMEDEEAGFLSHCDEESDGQSGKGQTNGWKRRIFFCAPFTQLIRFQLSCDVVVIQDTKGKHTVK